MYTLPNQPNCGVKLNFGPDFEFFPEDYNGRPVPSPLVEVPYHGFDNRVENGVSSQVRRNSSQQAASFNLNTLRSMEMDLSLTLSVSLQA